MPKPRKEIPELEKLVQTGRKKFVRYEEGAKLYSMGVHTFQELAKDAFSDFRERHQIKYTTLIDMIYSHQMNGDHSGITVRCKKSCIVLTPFNWQLNLLHIQDSIVFIDEGAQFVKSEEFALAIRNTDNYYVIATRASLFMLSYSIKEVYGIRNRSGNRYQGTKRVYSEFYPLNNVDINRITKPDCVVVEDSNAGFEFFSGVCREHFSWERFFHELLVEKTKDSYLHYNKKGLNPVYLQSNERNKIMAVMPEIEWK